MMRFFWVLPLFLFVVACSKKQKQEVISSEQLIPKASKDYSITTNDTTQTHLKKRTPVEKKIQDFIPNALFGQKNSIQEKKIRYLPNQISYSSKNNVFFSADSVDFHFSQWKYKDSLETINSFYNWLDCFGDNCSSIRINEEKNVSSNGFILWVSDTSLLFVESEKTLSFNKWKNFVSQKKNHWNFIITQTPNGSINWVQSIPSAESENKLEGL